MIFHDLPSIDIFAIAAIMIGPFLLGNFLIEHSFERIGGALFRYPCFDLGSGNSA